MAMREVDRSDFAAFLKEFQDETDRGAALVGAALLDQKLADTLRAFMVDHRVSRDLFETTRPLGTFAARIKTAFALGLVDVHEMQEMELIRKVRNEFAHSLHGTTFSEPEIAKLCDRLKSDLPGGREEFEGKQRFAYINAVTLTALRLTYRSEHVVKEKRVTKTWPY